MSGLVVKQSLKQSPIRKLITMQQDAASRSVDQAPQSNSNSQVSPDNRLTSSVGVPTTPRTKPRNPSTDQVFAIEAEMLKQPQIELPVKEYRSPGVYARELTIYAGCVLTGAVHKYEQLNILSSGRMRVLTDEGIVEVSAPFTIVSPPGTKRIAYAITDCVWTTILGTELTETEDIEEHFVIKTEEKYKEWLLQSQQLSQEQDWHCLPVA